jgi:hypothetical protein
MHSEITPSVISLVVAIVLFALGGLACMFPYAPAPNPPAWRSFGLMYGGLFFLSLSFLLR